MLNGINEKSHLKGGFLVTLMRDVSNYLMEDLKRVLQLGMINDV
jgi:hypothetical protein